VYRVFESRLKSEFDEVVDEIVEQVLAGPPDSKSAEDDS
jgi:hypothetical protein